MRGIGWVCVVGFALATTMSFGPEAFAHSGSGLLSPDEILDWSTAELTPAVGERPLGDGGRPRRHVRVTVHSPSTATGEPTGGARPRRLIEFGWDAPTASYLADHADEMQTLPFDGVVFTPDGFNVEDPPRLHALDDRVLTDRDLGMDSLARLDGRLGKLDHSFLHIFGPPKHGRLDWFDDGTWSRITANMEVVSRGVKASGAKGVFFDPEFYGDFQSQNTWAYHPADYPGRTFAEVAEMARQRGRQFISALQAHAPTMRFVSLFFPSYQYQHSTGDPLSDPAGTPDPLALFFSQGIVEGAAPGVQLVDGHEMSYFNGSTTRYLQDHLEMRQTRDLFPPESQGRWDGVQLGPGIFMDTVMGLWGGSASGASLSAEDRLAWLRHNVYWALQSSDEYAWFYSEEADWYRDPSQPAGMASAVTEARDLVARGLPLGYDLQMNQGDGGLRATITAGSIPLKAAEEPRVRAGEPLILKSPGRSFSSVTLAVDGIPVAVDSTWPFSFALREQSPGPHTVIAHAQLAAGGTSTSAPLSMEVLTRRKPAPRPARGRTGNVSAEVAAAQEVKAQATDEDGQEGHG
jgi:hypothetical protein